MAKKKIDFNLAKVVTSTAHFNDTYQDDMKGRVIKKINLDFLQQNPYQPRIYMDKESLQTLADSIQEEGLLQPITVKKENDQSYIIIYGHRRVAASKILDKSSIDAIVLEEVDHEQLSILPLIENLQREGMSPIETALSMKKILDDKIVMNQVELAKKIGYSKSWLSRIISILKLPDEIIIQIREEGYNDIYVLSALNKLADNHIEVFKKIVNLDRNAALKYISTASQKKPMAYVENRIKKSKNNISINVKGLSSTKKDQVNKLIEELSIILA
jgi:ParB family chromosome partitioning protein